MVWYSLECTLLQRWFDVEILLDNVRVWIYRGIWRSEIVSSMLMYRNRSRNKGSGSECGEAEADLGWA